MDESLQMKTYQSKTDTWLVVFIAAVLGVEGIIMIVNQLWGGLAIILAVGGLITYVFSSISYCIDGNQLVVHSGFFFKTTIQIDQIKKIAETNNPLSSPAASLDRIAIYYNTRGSVMISPKDKIGFIHQLKEINPTIVVVLKNDAKN